MKYLLGLLVLARPRGTCSLTRQTLPTSAVISFPPCPTLAAFTCCSAKPLRPACPRGRCCNRQTLPHYCGFLPALSRPGHLRLISPDPTI